MAPYSQRLPDMLRITTEGVAEDVQRVRLEGRLAGAYVAELSRVLQPSLAGPRRLVLDLRNLTFADAEGALLLQELVARDVRIDGCSGFVGHLLGLP